MSLYGGYDEFFFHNPDLVGTRKGGATRANTARRVHGKFAPNDPDKPFDIDMDSHRRGGIVGGRKRNAQVEVFDLRDHATGHFLPMPKEDDNG